MANLWVNFNQWEALTEDERAKIKQRVRKSDIIVPHRDCEPADDGSARGICEWLCRRVRDACKAQCLLLPPGPLREACETACDAAYKICIQNC